MTLGHKVWYPDALLTLDLLGWKRSSSSCSAFTMQVGAGGALQHLCTLSTMGHIPSPKRIQQPGLLVY